MKTVKDLLVPFIGKSVGIQMVSGQQVLGIGGMVEQRDDQVVLVSERRLVEGQPVPTNMGMYTPKRVIPETVIYLGDVPAENVIAIEVQMESPEEAQRLLEAEQSQITIPKIQLAGAPGFLPKG